MLIKMPPRRHYPSSLPQHPGDTISLILKNSVGKISRNGLEYVFFIKFSRIKGKKNFFGKNFD